TTGVAMWDALLYDMQQQRNDEDLMLKDISEIRDNEMEAAVVMIRQLARRLANRIGRRHRISSTVHAVDIRRSVRSSLRYGGVLMELKYRKPRIQKPTIVLIADVSGSMLKYSSFLLELMYGLSTVLPNIRSYVFAEKLKRLDLHEFNIDKFSHDKELGDGTNLYDSLLDFRADYDTMLNKKTVLIVLSDAKTIEYKKAAEEIESLSEKVKEILWLNPMPADEWKRFVQTKAMMPYVTMLEASSIQKLTKAVRDI
ncbi:MAG: VWA domain-containing protein, partial [Clostridia bacterium]